MTARAEEKAEKAANFLGFRHFLGKFRVSGGTPPPKSSFAYFYWTFYGNFRIFNATFILSILPLLFSNYFHPPPKSSPFFEKSPTPPTSYLFFSKYLLFSLYLSIFRLIFQKLESPTPPLPKSMQSPIFTAFEVTRGGVGEKARDKVVCK